MKRPEIKPLTSLRFFAALWVVAYHYVWPALPPGTPAWLEALLAGGFVGVPVFFVLSGFVLLYNYEGTDFGAPGAKRAFWVARFARIYPVYIVAFLLTVPATLYALWLGVPGLPSLRDHAIGAVLSPLLLQAWAGPAHAAWNTPGWTLSVEAAFYVAFPWMAAAAARGRLGRVLAATTAVSAALLAGHVLGAGVPVDVAMRNPLVHAPAFVVGMMLARHRAAAATLRPAQADALAGLGLAGIVGLAVLLEGPWGPGHGLANPLLNSLLLVPLVAAAVLGLAAPASRLVTALSGPALVALGDVSYGLYILQLPIARHVLYAPALLLGHSPRAPLAIAAFVAVLLAASFASYHGLERPAQRWLRTRLARVRAPTPPGAPATSPGPQAERA